MYSEYKTVNQCYINSINTYYLNRKEFLVASCGVSARMSFSFSRESKIIEFRIWLLGQNETSKIPPMTCLGDSWFQEILYFHLSTENINSSIENSALNK